MSEITVTLGASIISVSGTINGVSVTFTLVGTGLWQATVATASDGRYVVDITAVDSLGLTSRYQTTIYGGFYTVADRTTADVRNKTPKGFYNAEDLNRVEKATEIIAGKLSSAGYVVTVEVKTGWTKGELPYDTEMARYLGNVKKCVDNFGITPDTPALPASMDYLTHTGANAIERTLSDINMLIGNMEKFWRYSGTFYAGDICGLRGNVM